MLRLWRWLFSARRRHEKQLFGDGNSSEGWMLRLGVGAAKVNNFFWRWNFSVGWILIMRLGVGAAKVNGDGISAKDGC